MTVFVFQNNGHVLAAALQQEYSTAPLRTRAQQLESLEKDEFDILVVGGGATGCGVCLDAASRGRYS